MSTSDVHQGQKVHRISVWWDLPFLKVLFERHPWAFFLWGHKSLRRERTSHSAQKLSIYFTPLTSSGFSLEQFLTSFGPIQCVTYRKWPSYQVSWRPPVKITTIISSKRALNALGRFTAKASPCNRVPPFQFYPTGTLSNKGLQQLASLGDAILCLYNHGPVDSERLRQQPRGKMLVPCLPGNSLHRERLDSHGKSW